MANHRMTSIFKRTFGRLREEGLQGITTARVLHTLSDLRGAHAGRNFRHWVAKDAQDVDAASARLSQDILRIGINPKFKISRNAKVMTIGSCFARNVEAHLADNGVEVASRDFRLPREAYVNERANPRAALNKYNTHSIESEVLSALGITSYPDSGLINIDEDEWWDPLANKTEPGRFDDVLAIKQRIQAVTRKVIDCDAVIITLGMNQIWIDQQTGVYMNAMPPAKALRRFKDRFAIVLSDLKDNVDSLERTISAIRSAAKSDIKFVITVSPVPMGTTLTPADVIVANSLSKSMLRVCCQMLADKYAFVDYFPSYEMVINSNPSITWQPDRLHVAEPVVAHVTDTFVKNYLN